MSSWMEKNQLSRGVSVWRIGIASIPASPPSLAVEVDVEAEVGLEEEDEA